MGPIPGWPFCVVFACLLCLFGFPPGTSGTRYQSLEKVPSGYFFQPSKNLHVGLIGAFKLPIDLNVGVCGCLSVNVI